MSKNFVVLVALLSSTFVYSSESATEELTRSIGTQTDATEEYKVIKVSSKKDIPSFGEPYCLKPDKDNSQIIIHKDCLAKDFFLRANMIQYDHIARFTGKKSRVVNFVQKGKELLLIEKSSRHTTFEQLNPTLVLASYPIKNESDVAIAFDFVKGTKEFYSSNDWYIQEYYGDKHNSASQRYKSVPLKNVFIDDMFSLPGVKDSIQINIKARAHVPSAKSYVPTEVRYLFEPHVENPGFVPTKSEFQKNDTGFFEVEPIIDEHQNHVTYATKFDISKPIVYSISHNTPEEYRKYIRAGILYWNRAFGREVVKVDMAPEGMEAPSYTHNIVQWIHWKKAGFAYADAQADIKGQIKGAQVFLTSAFVLNAKKRVRRAFFFIDEESQESDEIGDMDLSLLSVDRGIMAEIFKKNPFDKPEDHHHHGHMCQHGLSKGFMEAYTDLISFGASSEVLDHLTGLYLMITTAHEIGHTLGLRHNFAGTLYGDLTPEQVNANFKALVENKDLPYNRHISSTVMDYISFKEDIIVAHQIMNSEEALPYDKKAIRKLYFGDEAIASGKDPLFCTDSHTQKYSDCKRFMFGRDPFTHTELALKHNFNELPYYLASHFYHYMKASNSPEMVLRDVFSDRYFDHMALRMLHPVWEGLKAMTDHSSTLQSQVNYGQGIDWSRFHFKREKHIDWLLRSFARKQVRIHEILSYNDLFNKEEITQKFMTFLDNEFDEDDDAESVAALKAHFVENREEIRSHLSKSLDRLRDHLDYIEVLQMVFTYGVSDEFHSKFGTSISQILSNYFSYKVKNYLFTRESSLVKRGIYEFHYKFPYDFTQIMSKRDRAAVMQLDPRIPIAYPQAKGLADQHAREVLQKTTKKLEEMARKQGGDPEQMFKGMAEAQDRLMASNRQEQAQTASDFESFFGKIKLIDEDPQATMTYSVGIPISLVLPKFRYKNKVRFLSTYLLNPYRNKSFDFGSQERSSVERQFNEFLDEVNPGLPINKFRLDGQDQRVAEWITFQRKLKHRLNTKEGLIR